MPKLSEAAIAAEHSLVARAFQAADQIDARRIVLVSAYRGEGKTHLSRCIERHASVVTDEPVAIVALDSGVTKSLREHDHGYVWIDGLTLLEGQGASMLTPSLRASIDGALLVVRGMATTRAEVTECAERLRVLEVPLIGGVWNERDHPPAPEALSKLRDDLRKWRRRMLPQFLSRQTRRSS